MSLCTREKEIIINKSPGFLGLCCLWSINDVSHWTRDGITENQNEGVGERLDK